MRVPANRSAYGTYGLWLADVAGYVAIGAGAAEGNALQGLPHGALEGGSPGWLDGQIKALPLACKVIMQLLLGSHQGGVCLIRRP